MGRASCRRAVATTKVDLLTILRERFGHDYFRPGQEQVVHALLEGRDALALLPTGGGKSLVYQLTAQVLDSVTIVVSPLLALMKDQLASLTDLGLDARAINSLQSQTAVEEALQEAARGETKLLYVTPERFEDADFVARVKEIGVSLFVVDEAHSISEWGHSFRPAYLELADAIERLGRPTVLALTATATQWVRRDIIERLRMREPLVVVRGTDRPNLFLEVVRVEEEHEDKAVLRRLLDGDVPSGGDAALGDLMSGSGIVYTSTTRAAEETAAWLQEWGIAADYYHGQRRKSDRENVQSEFMDGHVRVIAATNAFGLGVDKQDVRFVIHRDVPPSLEAYFQEAGRAGRDGAPARCTLIYRVGDLGRAAFLASTSQLTAEELERGWKTLIARGGATRRELEASSGLSRVDVQRLLELLEAEGAIAVRRGRARVTQPDLDLESVSLESEAQRRAFERSRLEMMRAYAELRECRRRYILNYFGEEPEWDRCSCCDIDITQQATPVAAQAPLAPDAFSINDVVEHPSLGRGLVQRVTAEAVTVLFDSAGYKTLALDLVEEQQLLHKRSN